MLVSNTPNVSIHNNAITDNTIYGVWSDTLTDATNNWWGNATGPNDNTAVPDACGLSIDNPAGTGSGASSCVLYDPWLVKNPFASAGSTVLPVGADGRPMMENQGEIPVFQVTSGQPTEISCGSQSVTLQIEDIKVTFTGLCGYEVVLDTISKDTLPSELGQGNNLEDGVTIRLLKGGKQVDTLPVDALLKVDYPKPANGSAAILTWSGSDWVVQASFVEGNNIAANLSSPTTLVLVTR